METIVSEELSELFIEEGDWFKLSPKYFNVENALASMSLDSQGNLILPPMYNSNLVELLGLYAAKRCQTYTEKKKT